jgi:hypothetical protein
MRHTLEDLQMMKRRRIWSDFASGSSRESFLNR